MSHNQLCPSAQDDHVRPRRGHDHHLWEGQGQVLSLPDHRDRLLGRQLRRLQDLQQLGGGHQAPVQRGGCGGVRPRPLGRATPLIPSQLKSLILHPQERLGPNIPNHKRP